MDLGELTLELATPLVGSTFEVELPEGETITMKLDEALPFEVHQRRKPRGEPVRKRNPFSLYFTAPLPTLTQGMYTLRGEKLTLTGIFLVPIGADEEVAEYEAVFA